MRVLAVLQLCWIVSGINDGDLCTIRQTDMRERLDSLRTEPLRLRPALMRGGRVDGKPLRIDTVVELAIGNRLPRQRDHRTGGSGLAASRHRLTQSWCCLDLRLTPVRDA